MDLPHPGHLARVLAVLDAVLLGIGLAALLGHYPDEGRKLIVMGVLVMLLVGVLTIIAARP